MKKFYFVFIAVAVMAALASCKKEVEPTVSLSADEVFGDDATATVTLTLSEASISDVMVNLEVGVTESTGKFLSQDRLVFEKDMVVRAGELKATQTISVKPDGLAAGEYLAVVKIVGAVHAVPESGKTIAYVKYTQADTEGPGSGDNGGKKNWVITYEGFREVEYQDGPEMSEVFKVTGQGSTPIYFNIMPTGTMDSFKDNPEDLFAQAEEWLASDLDFYSAYGWIIDDLVMEEDPHYEYYTAMEGGTIEIFVFGMTWEGKATGEYAWTTVEIPDGHISPEEGQTDVEMVLQNNWSVSIYGSVYTDDEGDDCIDIDVSLPGIKYYYAEENTQEDLDEYYGGSVAGFAAYNQDYCQEYIEENSMEDLMYYSGYPQTWIYVYNIGVPTTIYVVELDENGMATGRYGATDVVIPAGSGGRGLSPKKLKLRIRK